MIDGVRPPRVSYGHLFPGEFFWGRDVLGSYQLQSPHDFRRTKKCDLSASGGFGIKKLHVINQDIRRSVKNCRLKLAIVFDAQNLNVDSIMPERHFPDTIDDGCSIIITIG